MFRLIAGLFLVSCALSALASDVGVKNSFDAELNSITMSDNKHKSWCTIKAWWKYRWCVYKPKTGANWQAAEVKDVAIKACEHTYNFEKDNCAVPRTLSLDKQAQKHKSWCSFKSWVRKQWRKKEKVGKTDAEKAALDAKNEAQYLVDVAACEQRQLMKKMETELLSGNNHKSVCTFKNRWNWTLCKVKAGVNFLAKDRAAKLAQCTNELNAANLACPK